MEKNLPTYQNYLLTQLRYWLMKNKEYNVSKDDDNYFHFDNGKRFYQFYFDNGITFFGIREDGNTRYVFNGRILSFNDFRKINSLTD